MQAGDVVDGRFEIEGVAGEGAARPSARARMLPRALPRPRSERHALVAIGIDLTAIEAALGGGFREKIESRGGALEAFLSLLIAGADVGMQLLGKLPVRATNLVGGSGSADAEGGIRIPTQGV